MPRASTDYSQYLPYCETETQRKQFDILTKHGSVRTAANELNINYRNLFLTIKRVKANAARRGFDPEHDLTHPVGEGQYLKGASTLYDADGSLKMQWVKTSADLEQQKTMLMELAETLSGEVKGQYEPGKVPKTDNDELLSVYPIGDAHIGMFAWKDEVGNDYDLSIATRQNNQANERLAACAPASDLALIINVGDFFHADGYENRTPKSGYPLDVDTRFPKILRLGVEILKYKIRLALTKHKKVEVRNVQGNHDPVLTIALSMILEAYYSKEPRVTIHTSPNLYWYYRFGKNLIGATHGDKGRLENLGEIMATDAKEDWGQTDFRYWYTGHIHTRKILELRGCMVESFRTLAPADSFNHGQGYRSGRDIQCIVLHKDYGEVERHRVDISMIK